MGFLRLLLTPFSWAYGLGLAYRNLAYDRGWRPSISFDFPVIAVGNLRVGGTGKTPHVEYLVKLLQQQHKVATLSRGYGRDTKGYMLATALSLAEDIGDEPRQLKQKFPNLEVAVGENRAAAIPAILTDEPDVEVILLDDAFQHRAVDAGFKILLTAYGDLYTSDRLLPAGRLREGAGGAGRADLVLVTKCPDDLSASARREICQELRQPEEQVFFTGLRYLQPVHFAGPEAEGRTLAADDDLVVLSGIANPGHFEKAVASLHPQSEIAAARFRDHHNYTSRNLAYVAHKYAQIEASAVVTTEKDANRLFALRDELDKGEMPFYYLPIEVYFLERETVFNNRILDFVGRHKSA